MAKPTLVNCPKCGSPIATNNCGWCQDWNIPDYEPLHYTTTNATPPYITGQTLGTPDSIIGTPAGGPIINPPAAATP